MGGTSLKPSTACSTMNSTRIPSHTIAMANVAMYHFFMLSLRQSGIVYVNASISGKDIAQNILPLVDLGTAHIIIVLVGMAVAVVVLSTLDRHSGLVGLGSSCAVLGVAHVLRNPQRVTAKISDERTLEAMISIYVPGLASGKAQTSSF